MAIGGKVQAIRSSLPYQVLLYLNGWYFAFFFIAEILIFVFKGETLHYPDQALPAEVILVFLLAGLEYIRIFFGMKGNLTERMISVVMSLLMSVPAFLGTFYFLLWQTYVLKVEVIICVVQCVFIVVELLFGVVSIITFARATPY